MKKENIINDILKDLEILSFYGKTCFHKIKQYQKDEQEELNQELNRLGEVIDIVKNPLNKNLLIKIEGKLANLKDLSSIIKNLKNRHLLDIISLYELKIQALEINELVNDWHKLTDNSSLMILSEEKIIALLSDKNQDQINYDFYLYDYYSNILKVVRNQKAVIELKIKKAKTVEEKEELLKERNLIVIEEEKENDEVLKKLTSELATEIDLLEENIKRIGYLDFVIAKAKFAIKYQAIRPIISDGPILLVKMFDPILKEKLAEKKLELTKNDIIIDQGVCLITGANMSGKSTVIRTILINTSLALRGFYVFASLMKLPILDYIMLIKGDDDNINHGISSFGQEIMNLNQALSLLNEGVGLLLFDEFARSTNPYEGERFVNALIKLLSKEKVYSVISSHYDIESKEVNHYQVNGLKNIKYDQIDLKSIKTSFDLNQYIDYQLVKVENLQVPRDALRVAKLLKVNDKYLQTLEEIYRGDKNGQDKNK